MTEKQNWLIEKDENVSNVKKTEQPTVYIYYSRKKAIWNLIYVVLMLIISIDLFLVFLSVFLSIFLFVWVMFVILMFYLYDLYKRLNNKEPQIIITDKGIKTVETDFFEWKDIKNERVKWQMRTRGPGEFYLIYEHPKGQENLPIGSFNIRRKDLKNILIKYRKYYEQKNTGECNV